MARVEFKDKSVRQELHGTFGGLTYQTRNGQVFVHRQRVGDDARSQTIAIAVAEVQKRLYNRGEPTVRNMQELMDRQPAIKKTIENWYDSYRQKISDHELLVQALVYGYINKFDEPELPVWLHGKLN